MDDKVPDQRVALQLLAALVCFVLAVIVGIGLVYGAGIGVVAGLLFVGGSAYPQGTNLHRRRTAPCAATPYASARGSFIRRKHMLNFERLLRTAHHLVRAWRVWKGRH